MELSTTVAIHKKTKMLLIQIKGKLDTGTGKIHSMNDVIVDIIKNYQLGDGGEK